SNIVRNASVTESVQYEQQKIDIVGAAPNQVATVYDGQWFFASNDLSELKAVLDRADGRSLATPSVAAGTGKDRQSTLEADDGFVGAMKHMPVSYALCFYLQPKTLSENLVSLPDAHGVAGDKNKD